MTNNVLNNPYVQLNNYKKAILRKRINGCIERGEKFTLWIFDIDDTLNNSSEQTELQLAQINKKATIDYRDSLSRYYYMPDDKQEKDAESWDIKNQILEDYGKYCGAIDYRAIHNPNNLFSNSIETLNYMLLNRPDENTFIIICSQRNPLREELIKLETYYNYTSIGNNESSLDAIITLPVFDIPYEPNQPKREMTRKELAVMTELGIPSCYLPYCILVDDSPRVRRRFKNAGGIVIPAYLNGYDKLLEDEPEDRFRVLTSWDLTTLQTICSKIEYDRMIYEETKNFKKVLRR